MISGISGAARQKYLLALCLNVFLDAADGTFFKGAFRALEVDLGFSLKSFAAMQMCMSGTSMLFNPVWATVVDLQLISQRAVLIVTALGWGITSIALGLYAHSINQVICLRVVNILFLCSGMPVGQYIISSRVPPERRGAAFSVTGISGSMGVILSTKMSTTISELHLFGMPGWRFGLVTIGVASIAFAASTACLLRGDESDGEAGAEPPIQSRYSF